MSVPFCTIEGETQPGSIRGMTNRFGAAIMTTGTVFDIKRFSIHDGPGIRTTIFLKGCPLRCLWCHNPESQAAKQELILRSGRCIGCRACVDACPNDAISWDGDRPVTDRAECKSCGNCARECHPGAREIVGKEMTVGDVIEEVERDRAFYEESGGGVTFSGGEPLSQEIFLLELLENCRKRGFHTALDTCGHARWEEIDAVRPHVDLFLYDLRVIDQKRHEKYTGVSNEGILENLMRLSKETQQIILRIPIIPGINDDMDNAHRVADFCTRLAGFKYIELLPYHRIGVEKYARLGREYALGETQPPAEDRMTEIAKLLNSHGLRVKERINHNGPQ